MYRQFSAYIQYSFFTAFNFPFEICPNIPSFELFICGHSAPYTSAHSCVRDHGLENTGHILADAGKRKVKLLETCNLKSFA
jgi:hypothetical protein